MNRTPALIGCGEAMLRLTSQGHERLEFANTLEVHVGGAELNSLIAFKAMGGSATFVSRLARNPIGRRIGTHAVAHGVELVVDWVGDARAPLYFVEMGLPPRASEVVYDRSESAMATLQQHHFPWAELCSGKTAAYATGITCALSEGAASAIETFLAAAAGADCVTAFDLNFRSRLWNWSRAIDNLRRMLRNLSVLFAGPEVLRHLFDKPKENPRLLARRVLDDFDVKMVVLRETASVGAKLVDVTVTAVTETQTLSSSAHEAYVLDAFGAGDAATGVFLHSWLSSSDLTEACNAAAWAAAFQHTIPGDAWQGREDDVARMRSPLRRIIR